MWAQQAASKHLLAIILNCRGEISVASLRTYAEPLNPKLQIPPPPTLNKKTLIQHNTVNPLSRLQLRTSSLLLP